MNLGGCLMKKEESVERLECPVCGQRICDKEEGASGLVRQKCIRCKRVWRVDLTTNKFKLIS